MNGGVPEWSKGTDCKSVGDAFGGSNPPPSTIYHVRDYIGSALYFILNDSCITGYILYGRSDHCSSLIPNRLIEAGIAQLVEHQPSKLRVAGSRPVSRSIKIL